MSITDELEAVFSGQILPELGKDVTLASRSSTLTYDSRHRLVDTATQYGSATTYTAVVQPLDPMRDAATIAHYAAQGISLHQGVFCYIRKAVAAVEGDKLVYDGQAYTVRFAQPKRDGSRKLVCTRYGGERTNA